MKRIVTALVLLFSLTYCSKHNDKASGSNSQSQLQPKDDTLNALYFVPGQPFNIIDTTGNYIDDLILWGPSSGFPICTFLSSKTRWYKDEHIFRVSYKPDLPLLDSFVKREINLIQTHMIYQMNQKLYGKELFEIYDTTAHRMVSRIYAGKGLTIYADCLYTVYDSLTFKLAENYYFNQLHSAPLYYYRIGG